MWTFRRFQAESLAMKKINKSVEPSPVAKLLSGAKQIRNMIRNKHPPELFDIAYVLMMILGALAYLIVFQFVFQIFHG